MSYYNYILRIARRNNGTVTAKELRNKGIPTAYLSTLTKNGQLERVGRGEYRLPGTIEDELYVLQQKYPKMIFSHDMALCLQGVMPVQYFEITVTVPNGYKVPKNVEPYIAVFYIAPELHELEVTEVESPIGNKIRVYNVPRAICDMARSRKKYNEAYYDRFVQACLSKKIEFDEVLEVAKYFGTGSEIRRIIKPLIEKQKAKKGRWVNYWEIKYDMSKSNTSR